MSRNPPQEPLNPVQTSPPATAAKSDGNGSPDMRDIDAYLRMQSGSPITRAGSVHGLECGVSLASLTQLPRLLQPRSYVSSSSKSSRPRHVPPAAHTQDTIRDSTMEISSIPLQTPSHLSLHSQEAFIFPDIGASPNEEDESGVMSASLTSDLSFKHAEDVTDLEASTSTLSTQPASGSMTPRAPAGSSQPSGLSLLLARHEERSRSEAASLIADSGTPTPTVERPNLMGAPLSIIEESQSRHSSEEHARSGPFHDSENDSLDESAPLLSDLEANRRTYHTNGDSRPESVCKRDAKGVVRDMTLKVASGSRPLFRDILRSIPAVILGTLLNILDGISCMYHSFGFSRGV